MFNDFIDGQKACQSGGKCPPNASKDFKDGYDFEYQLQEIMSNGCLPEAIRYTTKAKSAKRPNQ